MLHAVSPQLQARSEIAPIRGLAVDQATLQRLVPLRRALRRTRAARRIDGHRVCAAVGCGVQQERAALAASLVQMLTDAWGQAPVIFHPAARLASFDEVWLLRLSEMQECGDADSLALLLGARVPRHMHRALLSLTGQLNF